MWFSQNTTFTGFFMFSTCSRYYHTNLLRYVLFYVFKIITYFIGRIYVNLIIYFKKCVLLRQVFLYSLQEYIFKFKIF